MSRTGYIPHLIFLLSLSLALGACAIPASQDAPAFDKVILRDVTVLKGGRVVELQSDGAVEVVIVAPGGKETRYASRVSADKVAELARLLDEHRFTEIEIAFRAPVPDEARPEIEVVWSSGERTVVAKWANDVHPDFDAIYEWLLRLADEIVENSGG
ncbi:MAG: hypothetical protein GXP42_12230 [Chloroflexi bacterium]|nr:hypothetical protein [Chloroflexota bacterium]